MDTRAHYPTASYRAPAAMLGPYTQSLSPFLGQQRFTPSPEVSILDQYLVGTSRSGATSASHSSISFGGQVTAPQSPLHSYAPDSSSLHGSKLQKNGSPRSPLDFGGGLYDQSQPASPATPAADPMAAHNQTRAALNLILCLKAARQRIEQQLVHDLPGVTSLALPGVPQMGQQQPGMQLPGVSPQMAHLAPYLALLQQSCSPMPVASQSFGSHLPSAGLEQMMLHTATGAPVSLDASSPALPKVHLKDATSSSSATSRDNRSPLAPRRAPAAADAKRVIPEDAMPDADVVQRHLASAERRASEEEELEWLDNLLEVPMEGSLCGLVEALNVEASPLPTPVASAGAGSTQAAPMTEPGRHATSAAPMDVSPAGGLVADCLCRSDLTIETKLRPVVAKAPTMASNGAPASEAAKRLMQSRPYAQLPQKKRVCQRSSLAPAGAGATGKDMVMSQLQELVDLVPNGEGLDAENLLEQAIAYVHGLQKKVQVLQKESPEADI